MEPDREVPLLVVDEPLPLPVEGEQMDLKAIENVTRLARTDSLLAARYERNQLLLADLDASTILFIDSVLAWFADIAVADQLLADLARDNTAALDLVLEEQEARQALAGDWLAAAKPSSANTCSLGEPSRCGQREAIWLPAQTGHSHSTEASRKPATPTGGSGWMRLYIVRA